LPIPCGHVIAKAQDKVGCIAARLHLKEVDRVRARMPCADHRVLEDRAGLRV